MSKYRVGEKSKNDNRVDSFIWHLGVNMKYSGLLYHLQYCIVLYMANICAWYSKLLYFRLMIFTCGSQGRQGLT